MPTPFNAYATLALPFPPPADTRPATPAELKKAYRTALLRWHPDKAGAGTGAGGGSRDGDESESKSKSAGSSTRGTSGAGTGAADKGPHGRGPTVDDITAAYATLSCPVRRRQHERFLVTARATSAAGDAGAEGDADAVLRLGLELVDLDDMRVCEGAGDGGVLWYRGCRCGMERGFVVREGELERADGRGEGEVLVGCSGCSLWIRVVFGVVGV